MLRKNITLLTLIAVLLSLTIFSLSYAAVYESRTTFEDESDGTPLSEVIDLMGEWEVKAGTPTSGGEVLQEEGNLFLRTTGYVDIRTYDLVEGPYTFSVDFRIAQYTDNLGFFVRAVEPTVKYNERNAGTNQVFNFFEWDWYAENGGKDGSSGIGGSGILVTPKQDGLLIRVKTFKPDGLMITSQRVSLPYPEGTDLNGFNTVKFEDDGESLVKIYLNETLIASLEMANPGEYEEDDDDDNIYFKSAVLKNAEGNELLNLDNARLAAGDCLVAIGNRNISVDLDNIYLQYEGPDPTDTPEPTPEPTKAPDATNTPEKSDDKKGDKDDGGEKANLLPIIIIAAVVIIAVVVIVVIVTKSKKR